MKKIKWIIFSIVISAAIILIIGVFFSSMREEEAVLHSKIRLSCDENGEFKVLIVADVHGNGVLPEEVSNNIKTLVDKEQPNLVIFTGDNTICSSTQDLRVTLDSMVSYIESLKIPWCHVYGNHDDEGGLSKEVMQEVYESYEYCISKTGPDLYGVGNYVLPIYKHNSYEINSLIWCLDSNSYLSDQDKEKIKGQTNLYDEFPNSPYDYIHTDQINWYKETSIMLEKQYGRKIPSLMAFHIPLQESAVAWSSKEALEWTGEKNEPVAASLINSGLFDVLKERQDVLAVVNGHEHINDFMVKYEGIKLCYSPNVSTLTYHDKHMMGSRVFIFNQDHPDEITTYVSYLYR